jgi:hypothetical protein
MTAEGISGVPVRQTDGRLATVSAHGSPPSPPRRRRTSYITKQQAKNLIAAFQFVDAIGPRFNVSIDIAWSMFSGFTDDQIRIARCQERLSKWFKRHGFLLRMIWVRETGRHDAPHVHVLIFVPPWLMENGEFQLALERACKPEGGPTHDKAIFIQAAHHPRGKLLYVLKGLRPKDAKEFGVRASFQGEIEGKRAAVTESIGLRARERYYWIRGAELIASVAPSHNPQSIRENSSMAGVAPKIGASKFKDDGSLLEPTSMGPAKRATGRWKTPTAVMASGGRG